MGRSCSTCVGGEGETVHIYILLSLPLCPKFHPTHTPVQTKVLAPHKINCSSNPIPQHSAQRLPHSFPPPHACVTMGFGKNLLKADLSMGRTPEPSPTSSPKRPRGLRASHHPGQPSPAAPFFSWPLSDQEHI